MELAFYTLLINIITATTVKFELCLDQNLTSRAPFFVNADTSRDSLQFFEQTRLVGQHTGPSLRCWKPKNSNQPYCNSAQANVFCLDQENSAETSRRFFIYNDFGVNNCDLFHNYASDLGNEYSIKRNCAICIWDEGKDKEWVSPEALEIALSDTLIDFPEYTLESGCFEDQCIDYFKFDGRCREEFEFYNIHRYNFSILSRNRSKNIKNMQPF